MRLMTDQIAQQQHCVPRKAFSEQLAFVEVLRHNALMLHSDQEPVLVQLLKTLQNGRPIETSVRYGPRISHQSQSKIKNANQVSTTLENFVREKLSNDSIPLAWPIRYAAWSLTKFHSNNDGRTALRQSESEMEPWNLDWRGSNDWRVYHSDRKSNKGTGGMESSVVFFKPRIHLFACIHLSVSISLDCMTGWRTSISLQPLFNTFGQWFLVEYKYHFPPSVSTCPVGGSLFGRSIQLCVENTCGSWFRVAVQASVHSPWIEHIWNVVSCYIENRSKHVGCGSLFAYWLRLHPRVSKVGLGFHVCVQASFFGPLWSYTFGLGNLVVHKLQSPPMFLTHCVVPGPCTSSACSLCLKHVGVWFLICVPSRPHQNEGNMKRCYIGPELRMSCQIFLEKSNDLEWMKWHW